MEREESCNMCNSTGICSSCHGQGKLRGEETCDMCDGTGRCFCKHGEQLSVQSEEEMSGYIDSSSAGDDLLSPNQGAVQSGDQLSAQPEEDRNWIIDTSTVVDGLLSPNQATVPVAEVDPKAKRALVKGAKKLPEFEKFFPQGTNFEVYATSKQASKCDVPHPGVRFIAQTCDKPKVYSLFAELDIPSIQNYCIVYYDKKRHFGLTPLHPLQKQLLAVYNADLYRAWLYTSKGKLDPGKAVLYPTNLALPNGFIEGVKVCGKLYRKMRDILRKNNPDKLDKIKTEFEKANRKILKMYGGVGLDYDLYYDLVTSFQGELSSKLAPLVDSIRTGSEAGDRTAAFFVSRPSWSMKIEPVYIVPNGKTTIVLLISPNSGYSFKYFKLYQPFYSFVKAVYDFLANM